MTFRFTAAEDPQIRDLDILFAVLYAPISLSVIFTALSLSSWSLLPESLASVDLSLKILLLCRGCWLLHKCAINRVIRSMM